METRLRIEGMTCGNCARHVQEALLSVPNVAGAEVDLETASALVSWTKHPETFDPLLQAVAGAGYTAIVEAAGADAPSPWDRVLFIGLPVTAILMLCEWVFRVMDQPWYGWFSLFLALPVQILVGTPFYRAAWTQLWRNRLTMDTLVALGSGSAFLLSLYGMLRPGALQHLYFMESVAILSLVGLGHWLEARIARRANRTLRTLLSLAPVRARRLSSGGVEEEVPVAELKPEDLILLKPGDRIPIDGEIVEGHGTFDESLLTGEATPAEKGPGMPVYAGTLNLNRRVVVRVTALGPETALSHIVAVVKRAQQSRAAIEGLVDKVSNIFVVAVISLAIVTLIGWAMLGHAGWEHALITAISVLIVACPCAMGLATPAAILAASNVAARRGVLFRDASALEKCGRINAVLFDKTGTLTESAASVTNVELHRMGAEEFGALARAMANPSTHPLSRSLTTHFSQAAQIAVKDWREVRGEGVQAQYQGQPVRLGSAAWLIASGVTFPDAALPKLGEMLGLAVGKELVGLITLQTRVRPEAARVVRQLIDREILVYMVTGDTLAAAHQLAAEVGIPEKHVFAGVRPERKAGLIIRLQAEGKKVAFVGDGINDAPALAQADLGIAVIGASDVARESADVVLLKRDLEALPEILALSLATLATIRQNLFWAFAYNTAAIPLAMAGIITPVFSALAMGLSDVFVMANAWRLSRWKPSTDLPVTGKI